MVTKVQKGRPASWFTKIEAPPVALALYEMVASLQHSDAFRTCHVYNGARDASSGVPMFKFERRVHAMPFIISSFMGIEYGKRTCKTPGCVNPFHYAPPSERMTPDQNQFTPPPMADDGFHELMDYYIEELGHDPHYSVLRPIIPEEDISDANLRTAIETYKSRS